MEAKDQKLEEETAKKEEHLKTSPGHEKLERVYHQKTAGRYIADLIFGANDGIVTTFAVVAGASGASFSPLIVVTLGLANLFADGLSMGIGNFLGIKSKIDYEKAQKKKEQWEIENLPNIEKQEVREILQSFNFKDDDLEKGVQIVTADKNAWTQIMLKEELQIFEDEKDNAFKHGFATFIAFVIAGSIPLLPFILPLHLNPLISSIAGTLGSLFIVGSLRSLTSTKNWFVCAFEMLIIGSLTAVAAYLIGNILGHFNL